MAEIRGAAVVSCDDKCGCTVPCSGGTTCRCSDTNVSASGGEHKTCKCGEHCSCNPCTCPKSTVASETTGRGSCQCGAGCSCSTCQA
uniref:Uncharacterized protein n=1 Tax=Fagus sylvatica TaxID=28930 RepID=A0A2N9FF88_FAGSY